MAIVSSCLATNVDAETPPKPKATIEVSGGVAEVTSMTDCNVTIIDYDTDGNESDEPVVAGHTEDITKEN